MNWNGGRWHELEWRLQPEPTQLVPILHPCGWRLLQPLQTQMQLQTTPHHPQCQCPPGPGHAPSPCQPHARNPCPCPSLPDLTTVAKLPAAQCAMLSHLVEVERK